MRTATTVTMRRTLMMTAALLLAGLGACGETEQVVPAEEDVESPELASVEQETFSGNLGTALGSPIAMGNTNGLTNEWTAPCITANAGNTAPEATFIWKTGTTGGTYTITTTGSAFDTTLDVIDLTGASIGCNDDANGTLQSQVVLTLTANTEYLINLDGWRAASGAYRLNITKAPPPTNSCVLNNACGGQAPAGCFCDAACTSFGDCCPDGPC
jgi:hypothetical protein